MSTICVCLKKLVDLKKDEEIYGPNLEAILYEEPTSLFTIFHEGVSLYEIPLVNEKLQVWVNCKQMSFKYVDIEKGFNFRFHVSDESCAYMLLNGLKRIVTRVQIVKSPNPSNIVAGNIGAVSQIPSQASESVNLTANGKENGHMPDMNNSFGPQDEKIANAKNEVAAMKFDDPIQVKPQNDQNEHEGPSFESKLIQIFTKWKNQDPEDYQMGINLCASALHNIPSFCTLEKELKMELFPSGRPSTESMPNCSTPNAQRPNPFEWNGNQAKPVFANFEPHFDNPLSAEVSQPVDLKSLTKQLARPKAQHLAVEQTLEMQQTIKATPNTVSYHSRDSTCSAMQQQNLFPVNHISQTTRQQNNVETSARLRTSVTAYIVRKVPKLYAIAYSFEHNFVWYDLTKISKLSQLGHEATAVVTYGVLKSNSFCPHSFDGRPENVSQEVFDVEIMDEPIVDLKFSVCTGKTESFPLDSKPLVDTIKCRLGFTLRDQELHSAYLQNKGKQCYFQRNVISELTKLKEATGLEQFQIFVRLRAEASPNEQMVFEYHCMYDETSGTKATMGLRSYTARRGLSPWLLQSKKTKPQSLAQQFMPSMKYSNSSIKQEQSEDLQ